MKPRLAIIATHPIQYYSPWFRSVAARADLDVRVFYLWDYGVREQLDPGFRQAVQWDIPLLTGYDHEFVPNVSSRPGTQRFFGIRSPMLLRRMRVYAPRAVLILGYNYAGILNFIFRWRRSPLLFRGDSHRLVQRTGLLEALRRAVISAVYRRFAAFLYVGSANYDYYRMHGVPEQKLFHAPHAVDNARFIAEAGRAEAAAVEWKRELGIPADDRVVIFVGKWEPKKRPLDLLRAFSSLEQERVSLLFIGGGVLENELRAAAAGNPRVFFAPFQNQTLMPRAYCAGDVLVLPSYGNGETWGLAVNEAMCMGRAVIASDHVGCARDLVVPYRNGLVFPAGDTQALAGCLREALSDDERLKAWGANGRERISAYSFENATAGLMKALDALGVVHAVRS